MTPAGKGQNEFYFTFIEAQINIRNSFLVCKQGQLRTFGLHGFLLGSETRLSANTPEPLFEPSAGFPWQCLFTRGADSRVVGTALLGRVGRTWPQRDARALQELRTPPRDVHRAAGRGEGATGKVRVLCPKWEEKPSRGCDRSYRR